MVSWPLIIGLGLFVTVLGTLGFLRFDEQYSFFDALYLTLQLFSMESGAVDSPSVLLEVARWMACFVLFSSLFKGALQATHLAIERKLIGQLNGHIIICGAGQQGLKIVNECLAQGAFVVLVDLKEKELLSLPQNNRIRFLHADATLPLSLEALNVPTCDSIFLSNPANGMNLDILINLEQVIKASGKTKDCFINTDTPERFSTVLNTLQFTGLNLRLFNFDDLITRELLTQKALDQKYYQKESAEVVVLGDANISTFMIRQIARTFIKPFETKISINVVGTQAVAITEELHETHPQLKVFAHLNPITSKKPALALNSYMNENDLSPEQFVVFICQESDSEGFFDLMDLSDLTGIDASQIALLQTSNFPLETFFNSANDSDMKGLTLFGLNRLKNSVDAIRGETLDSLAKKIHDRYLDAQLAGGAELGSQPAIMHWSDLDEQYKENNRRQADHIYSKLRYLNLTITRDTFSKFRFTEAEVETLAKIEHRRWCIEKYLDGWQHNETRNNLLRLHPDLIPWESLTEEIKDYDREPIKQIPKLLQELGLSITR